ncbi:MAG: hypothetical protein HDQ88_01360, partial [Clostridia bacterium]|nr:hypothetical protein [Clostridia bacterium]
WAYEWGLIDWDMDALEQWVVSTFAVQNRMSTMAHMVHHDEMLKAYLMERQPNTLIVQSHERPAGDTAPAAGAPDKYVLGYPAQSQAVYVRIEDEDDAMYIALADLKDW